MANVAFEELTKTVTSLPYTEQLALLDVLKNSTSTNSTKDPRIDAVNSVFGILSTQDAQEIRENKVCFNKDF